MKPVVITADIHANLPALERVLSDVQSRFGDDFTWADLGDVINYGPFPNECLDLVSQRANIMKGGDHELLVDYRINGVSGLFDYSKAAWAAAKWTAKQLNPKSLSILRDLCCNVHTEVSSGIAYTHASFVNPWKMTPLDDHQAARHFYASYGMNNVVGFVGHLHIPTIITMDEGRYESVQVIPTANDVTNGKSRIVISTANAESFIASVPSVGFPRDRVRMTGYCVYYPDTRKVEFNRLQYDMMRTVGELARSSNRSAETMIGNLTLAHLK